MDIQILNQGTLIGFRAISEAGAEWIKEHLDAPDYMRMGRVIWSDHRMAQPIIDGMEADGMVLQ
jgi:hypothetical protein